MLIFNALETQVFIFLELWCVSFSLKQFEIVLISDVANCWGFTFQHRFKVKIRQKIVYKNKHGLKLNATFIGFLSFLGVFIFIFKTGNSIAMNGNISRKTTKLYFIIISWRHSFKVPMARRLKCFNSFISLPEKESFASQLRSINEKQATREGATRKQFLKNCQKHEEEFHGSTSIFKFPVVAQKNTSKQRVEAICRRCFPSILFMSACCWKLWNSTRSDFLF